MKKLLFVMLALLIVIPTASSYSADFNYAALWSDNLYYESTAKSEYGMRADTSVTTNGNDVYMYIPSWTAADQYQLLDPYTYFGGYYSGKFFNTTDGYPPPGSAYEAREIYFFIDENGSGMFEPASDPNRLRNYPSATFNRLPLVQNVYTFSAGSDVVVSWDGIPLENGFGDEGNDQYRARIIDPGKNEIVFDSESIFINQLNKYAYNFGDLSSYGENFYIAIEARDFLEGQSLVNRSRYYAGSPVPEPATMLLLGSGLIGLVGFRRKFKK